MPPKTSRRAHVEKASESAIGQEASGHRLLERFVSVTLDTFLFLSGLSEVLCGLGKEHLEKLMPEVISTTSRLELLPHVREGYLMLYIYLPSTFKEDFVPYIGSILPSILKVRRITFTVTAKPGSADICCADYLLLQSKVRISDRQTQIGRQAGRQIESQTAIWH